MKKQLVVSLTLVVVVTAFLSSSSSASADDGETSGSGGHVLFQNKNDPPPERKLSGEADEGETAGSSGGHVLVQNKNDPPAPERKLQADPIPANPYTRGCNPAQGCRTGRRLLTNSPLPKVSAHGPQHRLRHEP